jgi:hypothetical protein
MEAMSEGIEKRIAPSKREDQRTGPGAHTGAPSWEGSGVRCDFRGKSRAPEEERQEAHGVGKGRGRGRGKGGRPGGTPRWGSKTCEENRPMLQQWYPGHMRTGGGWG